MYEEDYARTAALDRAQADHRRAPYQVERCDRSIERGTEVFRDPRYSLGARARAFERVVRVEAEREAWAVLR